MHQNCRRSHQRYRLARARYNGCSRHPHKKAYWAKARAREQVCLVTGRYDALITRHPRSILWDAF